MANRILRQEGRGFPDGTVKQEGEKDHEYIQI